MTRSKIHATSALALLIAVVGCNPHDHDHRTAPEDHDRAGAAMSEHGHDADDHGHDDHGDDEHVIAFTRWTDQLEFYVEHPPAVAAQDLTLVAHITVLDDFRALENAKVSLILTGPERIETQAVAAVEPGIFLPTLVAPQPGTYRGRLRVTGPDLDASLDDFEILVHPSAEAAEHAAEHAADEQSERAPITFLKQQQWQVPFATAFAVQGTVIPALEVSGEITTPPSGQADVGASVAGMVVASPAGLPLPGQTVRRGELLASIAAVPAAPEDAARAELAVAEAEARLQAARAAVERATRLLADRAIAQRELDEARRELGVAEESVRSARRARDLYSGAASGRGAGTHQVTAPLDGVVVAVHATAGKSVASGELLFRVVDFSELWIRARVPEQDAARLSAHQDASIALPGVETALELAVTGNDASASVVNIGRTVDPDSRTVDVIYALRRPDERLRVGGMVRVGVPIDEPWHGVIVPRSAVLDDDGRFVVYVQVEGESFEERAVRLGPGSQSQVGIASGVGAGERVVSRGANIIRVSARAADAPAHGHVH